MFPSEARNLLERYGALENKLKSLGFIVREVSGYSNAYYAFVGLTSEKRENTGNSWIFTAEGIRDFVEKAEIFVAGAESR